MKKKNQKKFYAGAGALVLFVLWTVLVRILDVQPIGPEESCVGFATINGFVHQLTGVHMVWYTVTDLLSVIPLCLIAGFGIFGMMQWIKRKSIRKVDGEILLLGAFYVVVMAIYVLFENVVINYRPVLIDGCLEVSYPSSTTMLVMSVMPTAVDVLNKYIKNKNTHRFIACVLHGFVVFMVGARFVSGVHWFTDIVGGGLVSFGVVSLYNYFRDLMNDNKEKHRK